MSTDPKNTLQLLLEFSVPLIIGVVSAVLWANADPHSYHQVIHWAPSWAGHVNLHFLFNDIFMVFFFGIAAKEITEACLPGGSLNPPSRAVNPLLATLGGVLGPIGFYFLFVGLSGDSSLSNGWGIPTATDIALAWLVARMVFGNKHPAVSFLLLLAVADDGIGLAIIAIAYPDATNPVAPIFMLLILGALIFSFVLRRNQVTNFWFYILGPGILSWTGFYLAHLHPALALVPVIPFMPSMGHDDGLFDETNQAYHNDTLNNFEHSFKVPVDLGLFGFGLANAGVAFGAIGPATWAVFLSLVIGKTVGIFAFSGIGHALGFRLPEGMGLRSLALAGLTAALGLTVALFVAGEAFPAGDIQDAAKMGALFSAAVAPLVVGLGIVLRIRKVN